jgi:hypothetical protein
VEADYGGLCLTELGPAYYRRPSEPDPGCLGIDLT